MYLPHKNHRTLIEALYILKKSNKHQNLKLVCCGNDIGYLQNLKNFVKKKEVRKRNNLSQFCKR